MHAPVAGVQGGTEQDFSEIAPKVVSGRRVESGPRDHRTPAHEPVSVQMEWNAQASPSAGPLFFREMVFTVVMTSLLGPRFLCV
jgi:hypothetical protein